jgi:hypothetical protein
VSAPPLGNVQEHALTLSISSADAQTFAVDFTPFILVYPRILSSPLFPRARGPLPAPEYQRRQNRDNPRQQAAQRA